MRGIILSGAMLLAGFGLALPAAAGPNLVVNGGFEQTNQPGGPAQINTTNVAGWSSTGYNFIFAAGTAGTSGSYTPQFNGNVSLWSDNNGFTNSSPNGGNYVGADGAYEVAPITQTISGLTAGDTYGVSFYWAAAQQRGFDGPTTEAWQVSLGDQTQETAVYGNVSHGFSGWMAQTFDFTATSGSEVLSFLAVGTPAGEPPFSLLDGVTLNDVPEPASLALMGAGLASLAGLSIRGRARA